MDELDDIWQRLKLNAAEGEEIKVSEDKLEQEIKKRDCCLVGKIHMDRAIVREVLLKTMQKVW